MPAAQLTHVEALSWSLNVPGAQLVGVSEPMVQKVPIGQVTQSSTLVMTVRLASMWDPPGHGIGATAPDGQ